MLKIKNIRKGYQVADYSQEVLKGVTLNFRKNELVAILGQSGSGKTTLLNIIGGLDYYDSGDLIISGKSTKRFKSMDWDVYRNKKIGFIFQDYNLISHISVIKNIEMGMILKGIRRRERKRRALDALDRVGLVEHANKKPNQLSGGQKQRIAIARALVNSPDIILADEPTGALDDSTGVQIIELIKEISKDTLVIMVTHNNKLAEDYASRIIQLKDGVVINDSDIYDGSEEINAKYKREKVSMNYFQALLLSFNNIKTKLGRVISISFAASVGITGISLILALSNGFQSEIDMYEQDSLSQLPIVINTAAAIRDDEGQAITKEYQDNRFVVIQNDESEKVKHRNKLTSEYVEYIMAMDSSYISALSFQYGFELNVINEDNGKHKLVDFSSANYWQPFPFHIDQKENTLIEESYDVLAGSVNNDEVGLILVVDKYGQISKSTLRMLGINSEDKLTLEYDEILNKELKIVFNDEYYIQENDYFRINQDVEAMYKDEKSQTVKVQAILRGKQEKEDLTSATGIYYTRAVSDLIIERNKTSQIVNVQNEKKYNVLTGELYEDATDGKGRKEMMLAALGSQSVPSVIQLYPSNYEAKDLLLDYLKEYNTDKADTDKIEYVDTGASIVELTRGIMSAITAVLVAFSGISLVVSCIMITIITYISVLERTKEIGILRALGARKKDISRVFNAETIIIGFIAGVMGVTSSFLLANVINGFIANVSNIENIASFDEQQVLILVGLSVLLTMLSGFFPALSAAAKNPVEALRSE